MSGDTTMDQTTTEDGTREDGPAGGGSGIGGAPLPFGTATTRVAGEVLTLLPSGAAWWAAERTLIVADLHFEKGSSFARRGALLPPHDTVTTLARLEADMAASNPARVVSLGDAFHDPHAPERLGEAARARLDRLVAGCDWLWIDGNHDAATTSDLGGRRAGEAAIGPLVFRHEPRPRPDPAGEIAGHLHPAARVKVATGTVRRRCFAGDGRRLILPAYGAYAGGLDVASRAFAGLFDPAGLAVHLLGRGAVHAFPARLVVGAASAGGLNRGETGPRRSSR